MSSEAGPLGAAARVIARRRAAQAELVARARDFAAGLDPSLGTVAAVVVGSVARGDFNLWSDLDLLVVAESLPRRSWDRALVIGLVAPPGLSPMAWTPAEYLGRLDQGDLIAVEARAAGIVVRGRLPEPPAA